MTRAALCSVALGMSIGLALPASGLEPIPDQVAVLTFDDLAKSHFTSVRPLLKELGFGATFFVTEGFGFRDNKRDFMSWEEIAQLHREGFEIKGGRIAVLQFHGVPDTAHDWVSTPSERFREFMVYLAKHRFKVIAMRDLAKYVDPTIVPTDPMLPIEDRRRRISQRNALTDGRLPASAEELQRQSRHAGQAIWVRRADQRELLSLAHTHIDTIWTQRNLESPAREWDRSQPGECRVRRELPNQVAFGANARCDERSLRIELSVENHSRETLRGLDWQP